MKQDARRAAAIVAVLLAIAVTACSDAMVEVSDDATGLDPQASSHTGLEAIGAGSTDVGPVPPGTLHEHDFRFTIVIIGGVPHVNLDWWDRHIPLLPQTFHYNLTGVAAGPGSGVRVHRPPVGVGKFIYVQGRATKTVPTAPPIVTNERICVWIYDGPNGTDGHDLLQVEGEFGYVSSGPPSRIGCPHLAPGPPPPGLPMPPAHIPGNHLIRGFVTIY
ncbi:MAG: hypothetical protein HY701_13660 [Gemmatimonadetes bacterium]|nr:hypothetical protein [Gemmatimonadota bacterium]